jgi:hypothetical protein
MLDAVQPPICLSLVPRQAEYESVSASDVLSEGVKRPPMFLFGRPSMGKKLYIGNLTYGFP